MVVGSFVVLTGCSINSAPSATSSEGSFSLQGRVMGGQQPVSGASFQLYAVGNTGDGSAAYPLIPTGSMTVGSSNNYYPNGSSGCTFTTGNPNSCSALPQTNSSGVFNITGDWGTCTSNQAPAAGTNPYLYIVATGGNPGGGNNANFSEMAALGLCNTLTSSTFIVIDEVTTVGSIAALYPYMSSYSATGSAIGDAAKLALAFTAATTEYMSTATGASPGSGLPTGYYASSTEINSLADSISSCINSTGGTAGQNNACGNLFTDATPPGGTAPTDTIGAIIDILKNPTLNVAAIYGLAPGSGAPFVPTLANAPAYWTLPIIAGAPSLPSAFPPSGNYTITNGGVAWDNKQATAAASGLYLCPIGSACTGAPTFAATEQEWTLTEFSPGQYTITSLNSNYPTYNFGTASGGIVYQGPETAGGSNNWVWTLVPAPSGSGYLIYDNWPLLPVDATGNNTTVASGNELEVKTSTGGTSQVWNLNPVGGSSCPATAITPQIWTSTYGWESLSSLSLPPGVEVSLSAEPSAVVGNSAWSWTGSNGFSSSTLQNNNVPLSAGTNTFTLTYTNSCGNQSTLTYTVNVGQTTLSAASCDVLKTAGTPCAAAYSLTRRMFAAYTGNLFQLSCASCSPTTLNIGTSSTTGEVNVAAAASYCSTAPSACYISTIYDQTANANNLTATSGTMALYQASPYNGLPILQTTAPTPTAVTTYTNGTTVATISYTNASPTGIPKGNAAITEYYVRSNFALLSTVGDFGDTTLSATQPVGDRFTLGYSAANGSAGGVTNGAYYCVDVENTAVAATAYATLTCGASGTAPTTSQYVAVNLPSPPLFTLIGKYTGSASGFSVQMADATVGGLSTLPITQPTITPAWGGQIALGEGGNGDIAMSSFQEGAIVAAATTSATDASLQSNVAAFYGQFANYSTTGSYLGPCDAVAAASGTTCTALTSSLTTSAWWGLRAYSNAFASAGSSAVQLQRASDLTKLNIPVTATGDLNVQVAQAFCQNTICGIFEWYDQTGNGHNMTVFGSNFNYEATLLFNCANQTKVCANFEPLSSNALNGYQTTFSAAIPQPFTYNAVWDKTDALYTNVGAVLSSYNQGGSWANFGPASGEATQNVGANTTPGGAGDVQPAHSYVFQSHTSEYNNTATTPVYINGVSSMYGAGTDPTGPVLELGSNLNSGYQPFVGFIQESAIWSTGLTAAQVVALTANQRAYWQF